MVTSTQITERIKKQPDPLAAAFKIWQNTRYLVAQHPAAVDYSETKQGYYKGRTVIPGPKYNPRLSEGLGFKALNTNDFQTMMNTYHIRFIDNHTTDNADQSVIEALYTVMTDAEADDYENELRKLHANRRKTVPGPAA